MAFAVTLAALIAAAAPAPAAPIRSAPAAQPADARVMLAQARPPSAPRGSSAQIYGGSSAERYGGTSADRSGIAGPRDPRVYGRPQRERRIEEKAKRNERPRAERDDQDREED